MIAPDSSELWPINLRWFRQFYIDYPNLLKENIHHAVRDKSPTAPAFPTDPAIHHAVRDELDAEGKSKFEIRHAVRGKFIVTKNSDATEIRHPRGDESWIPGQLNPNLSWTHYRTLLKVKHSEARSFYEIESAKDGWSARQLERRGIPPSAISSMSLPKLSHCINRQTAGAES